MSKGMQRREFLQLSGALLTGACALGLGGCGDSNATAAGNDTTLLQMTYWGAAVRVKRTNQVITQFEQKYPKTKISSQYADFGSYWPKLATEISGNSEPDLIQMDMRYIAKYVQKGLLLDLSPYITSKINLSDFNQVLLKGSEANGNVYGVPMGANFMGIYYNQNLIQKTGLPLPEQYTDWTWDGFADYTLKLSKALGPNVYGTEDSSSNIGTVETFIRQRGKELYTTDGKLGYDEQDIQDWFGYWDRLRKIGACAPAGVQNAYASTSASDSGLVTGVVAIAFNTSNLIQSYQGSTTHKLGLYFCPVTKIGGDPGYYLKPSMLISASATTKYKDVVTNFINFMFNDNGAIKALAIERGIPGSLRAQNMLEPQMKASDKKQLMLIRQVTATARPKTVLDSSAAGIVEQLLGVISQGIAFGKLSVSDGSKMFFDQASQALERNR